MAANGTAGASAEAAAGSSWGALIRGAAGVASSRCSSSDMCLMPGVGGGRIAGESMAPALVAPPLVAPPLLAPEIRESKMPSPAEAIPMMAAGVFGGAATWGGDIVGERAEVRTGGGAIAVKE